MDTALGQLAHRRRTLPEHALLASLRTRKADLDSDLVGAETEVSDLEQDQARAEADLEPVRERLERDRRRIADGSVHDSKALSGLVDEVEHLLRRIGELEDAELEVMEALEGAVGRRTKLEAASHAVADEMAGVAAKRDLQLAELAVEVADQQHDRATIVAELPADLMALYTRIGAGHGGVGAAALAQRRCTGCQLEISSADLRQFAAAAEDDVLRCEECSRILVRTSQSGL